jgi:hypothetical protein
MAFLCTNSVSDFFHVTTVRGCDLCNVFVTSMGNITQAFTQCLNSVFVCQRLGWSDSDGPGGVAGPTGNSVAAIDTDCRTKGEHFFIPAHSIHFRFQTSFFKKSCLPAPWRVSVPRPIAPIYYLCMHVAGGNDTTRLHNHPWQNETDETGFGFNQNSGSN